MTLIKVVSPQFKLALEYKVLYKTRDRVFLGGVGSNSFIDKCILYLLVAFRSQNPDKKLQSFELLLLGDNSFYSQRNCEGGYFPDGLEMQPAF